jgi:predicted unusual protein kinase regulating ubiquinone biosynthesis (AarF/ABC1/UbiB family)
MWGHLCTWFGLTSQVLGYYLWYYVAGYRTSFYERTLRLLRNHNILFTKIFQSLANSPSLTLEPDLRSELAPYTATVSYTPDEIDTATLDAVEAAYNVQINRQPINSGMIALVFHGFHRNENQEPVILKLKRRGIDARLLAGCQSVTYFYNQVAYWFPRNLYVRVLRPFIRTINDIIEQCNFGNEIQNMVDAKRDYAELEFVKIPDVYNREDHRTGTPFILMEKIQGVHSLPPETPEEDRLEYLRKFCLFTCFGFVSNAIQHIDLHSGNVLYTPSGLGIIDFGMALRCSDEINDIIITSMEVVREPDMLNRLDVIEEARHLFVPSLTVETMQNVTRAGNIIRDISRQLSNEVTMDELNLTDQLDQLSADLGHEVVLHPDVYKFLLGMSMMGCAVPIMGPYYNHAKLLEYERTAVDRALLMVMT